MLGVPIKNPDAPIHKDRPMLGVIYTPVKDTFYFAADGLGAYKMQNYEVFEGFNNESKSNEELLQKIINNSTKLLLNHSITEPINHITIIGSRSHKTKQLEEFVESAREGYGRVESISAGSSLKFCLIAEGLADIYPRFGPTMEWDTAAGQAIVEQAGGYVMDVVSKESLRYNKSNLMNPWFIAGKRDMVKTVEQSYLPQILNMPVE